jgi:hypothetical protein
MLTWLGRVSAAGGSVSGAKLESALHGVTTEDLRERATTRKAVKDEVDDLKAAMQVGGDAVGIGGLLGPALC